MLDMGLMNLIVPATERQWKMNMKVPNLLMEAIFKAHSCGKSHTVDIYITFIIYTYYTED